MPFPIQNDITEGLIALIHSRGDRMVSRDTYDALADFFDLTLDERTITRPIQRNRPTPIQEVLVWHDKVQWARRHGKNNGLIEIMERGTWCLTAAGRERAKSIAHKFQFR